MFSPFFRSHRDKLGENTKQIFMTSIKSSPCYFSNSINNQIISVRIKASFFYMKRYLNLIMSTEFCYYFNNGMIKQTFIQVNIIQNMRFSRDDIVVA